MSVSPPQSLQGDENLLVIVWDDDTTHRLTWELLRKACPCATCRSGEDQPAENTDNPLQIIRPEEAQPLRPTSMQPMGNYAYSIAFNDGHNTGIYTLEYLRLLGDEAARRANP